MTDNEVYEHCNKCSQKTSCIAFRTDQLKSMKICADAAYSDESEND